MRVKQKHKILLILIIVMFIADFVFNCTNVEAVDIDKLEKILQEIPNEINLNIKETEFEEAEELVKSKIEERVSKDCEVMCRFDRVSSRFSSRLGRPNSLYDSYY